MKKWVLLDSAATPEGKTLTLHEHDGSRSIRIDGAELMNTRERASEEQLALITCAPIKHQPHLRILIGGLGLGFTMRTVLATLAADAKVDVVELIPAIIRWNELPADDRLSVMTGDVVETIRKSANTYDGILLDIDNGPEALTTRANGRLYTRQGLAQIFSALRPGGHLGVWSVDDDPRFSKLMEQCGFATNIHHSRAHTTSGGRRTIFTGRKAS